MNKLILKISERISILIIIFGIKSKLRIFSLIGYFLSLIIILEKNLFSSVLYILKKRNKPYIIFLSKEGFNQDVSSLQKGLKNYKCLKMSRNFVKSIAKCFLSKDIDDNNYQSSAKIHNKSKNDLYNFYFHLFSKLPQKIKPKAITTGNFGYFAEQELFRAAYDNGIKTIALHKECLKTPGRIKLWHYIYSVRRGVFGGSLILVYNSKELNLQKDSGIVDPNRTNIKIIGTPRIDKAHHQRKNSKIPINHKVVLFGFGLKSGLPVITRKSYGDPEPYKEYLERNHKLLKWEKLIFELCDTYYRCAVENPLVKFTIKLKKSFRDNNAMIQFFKTKTKLSNLFITTEGDSLSILRDATIALGFNSTSIFESIARGIPVIVPNFGECCDKSYKPYFIDFSNTDIITVNSTEELRKEINQLLLNKPNPKKYLSSNQISLLNEWVGNSDGNSNKRLINEFKKELK